MVSNATHIYGNVYCFPFGAEEIIFDFPIKKIKNVSETTITITFPDGFAFALENDDTVTFPNIFGYPVKLGVGNDTQVFIQVQEYGIGANENYFKDRKEEV